MRFLQNFSRGVGKVVRSPEHLRQIGTKRFWQDVYMVLRFGEATDLSSARWANEGNTFRRHYRSYREYTLHQASKLNDRSFRKVLDSAKDDQYAGFLRRFSLCQEISGQRCVLCLGARLGTEVEAFKELGFFAVGIDLNPGAGNAHVHFGDFHNLAFNDGTVDVVYSNVLDHAFDLERMMTEVARVLKPGGFVFFELLKGSEEGLLPHEYEAAYWKRAKEFADHLSAISGMPLISYRSADELSDLYWNQAVFQKEIPDGVGEQPRHSRAPS